MKAYLITSYYPLSGLFINECFISLDKAKLKVEQMKTEENALNYKWVNNNDLTWRYESRDFYWSKGHTKMTIKINEIDVIE